MLPREIFEILHAVMAVLVLFEHFSGKYCLNFLTLILSTVLHQIWCLFNQSINQSIRFYFRTP